MRPWSCHECTHISRSHRSMERLKRLKRLGSKLRLRKDKEPREYSFWGIPLVEDPDEERGWPIYNPSEYDKFEQQYVSNLGLSLTT